MENILIPALRAYQLNGIEQLRQSMLYHRMLLLVIGTGGGKTTIAAEMIRRCLERQRRVLFLAHRKELIEQARNRLLTFGINPGVIMAGWKQNNRPVMVASQQTLIRRELPPADVIFVDEAHHSTSPGFSNILNQYPQAFIIGLTATPYRLDGKGLGMVGYTDIVAPITVGDLTEAGYLVTAKYYGPKRDMSTEHLTAGDYNTRELYEKFNKPTLYAEAVKHYNKFAPGSKAIVFNVNVEHSLKMAQEFNDNGITCAHLDGETPILERAAILQDFANGRYQVLCNVNLFTEGYDLPALETVILNRSTKSRALYKQMVGRGLRPAPSKSHCTVIDQGGNVYQHGPIDAEEEYSLESKKKGPTGAPPMKECPNCYLLMHAGAPICPECKHIFTIPIHQRELPKEVFEELNFFPKKSKAAKKLPVPDHLMKAYRDMSREELEEYAEIQGYKPGWVWIMMQNNKNEVEA